MNANPHVKSIETLDRLYKLLHEKPGEVFTNSLDTIRELSNSARKAELPEEFIKISTMGPALAEMGAVSKTEVSVALFQLGVRIGRAQATPAG